MKKLIIIFLATLVFSYSGCHLNENIRIGWATNLDVLCINGFKYFVYDRGISPMFSPDRKLIKCGCKE